MSETIELHNPLDLPQRFTLEGREYECAPHGSIEIPLRLFRGVLHVRCEDVVCRPLGYCTRGHAGAVYGGQAPAMTYQPRKEQSK